MSNKQIFRFRVRSSAGGCSQDWRIWTDRNEIYVGARNTSHEYKASFHSSGQCHVGISRALRESLVSDPEWEGKSRLFSAWKIDPSEYAAGRQHLVELVFSDSHLDVPDTKNDTNVCVLESHPGIITAVAVIRDQVGVDAVLSSSDPTFVELHRMQLPSGHAVIVLKRELPETPAYHEFLRMRFPSLWKTDSGVAGRSYGERPNGALHPGIRVLVWDGSGREKYWHEMSSSKIFLTDQDPENFSRTPRQLRQELK